MFVDGFTFDHTPRPSVREQSRRERSRSISPCSSAALAANMADSRFTLTDLAAQFAGQRLRREAQMCYDSCEAYANLDDDDAGWQLAAVDESATDDSDHSPVSSSQSPFSASFAPVVSRTRSRPGRSHSPSNRVQRQLNARLLCSSTHHRDIADLVSKMVSAQDQCSVSHPPALRALDFAPSSPSSTGTIAVDDDDDDDDDEHETDDSAYDDDDDDEGYKSGSNSTSRRASIVATRSSSTSLSSATTSYSTCAARIPRGAEFTHRRASDRKNAKTASVCKATRFRRESNRPMHVRRRSIES